MSYKLQFLIDEVLQCLVDKYQITYQIIIIIIIIIILGGGGLVRLHSMESSYCKTLWPLKGAPIWHIIFYKKKYF